MIFLTLSLLGTAVFAISGALQAMRREMDIVGVAFIACVTGVGGGTMRDLLLGATPVGWVTKPTDIFICIGAAIITVLLSRFLVGKRLSLLIWADAVGLALFAVLGASKAVDYGAHPFIAVLFGAMSATFGGIVRDIICNEIPVLFHKEIYITAALVGAGTFVLMPETLEASTRILIAVLLAFSVRALAIRYNWSLRAS
ncbi:trimeric intracellular cation channel family protein [Kordiimonas sediminis]|nr:trimeric intracellular cation channel family protein [Kordiimonas sediminis]